MLACAGAFLLAAALVPRADRARAAGTRFVQLADLRPPLRSRLAGHARSAAAFDAYVQGLERETAARVRDGEADHLVHYLLQSHRFTKAPRIEPASSAAELVAALEPAERAAYLQHGTAPGLEKVPASVRQRVADFVAGLEGRQSDARLAWFKRFLGEARADHLLAEYARAMRFLYRKEFGSRSVSDPQALEEYLAALYRERGHSTDTQIENGFAVHVALGVIRAAVGQRPVDHVLVVGPGLDFAPRTDLIDLFDPQSYQPFAVADALLGFGLSTPAALRVHCVDVNARVVAHLRGLSRAQPTSLNLLSGVPERPARPFSPDYREYFGRLGASLGEERALAVPKDLEAHLKKRLDVRPEIAALITADLFNVVTQRYDPAPAYDLVVVTNVFSYFEPREQALALANVEAMLRPGGFLVHNEPQTSLVSAAEALGLALVQARTVRIASGASPLFDRILVHRKKL